MQFASSVDSRQREVVRENQISPISCLCAVFIPGRPNAQCKLLTLTKPKAGLGRAAKEEQLVLEGCRSLNFMGVV